MSVNNLGYCLYLGATQYDENYNIVPSGDGWKILLGEAPDGRKTLKFVYVASDLTETTMDELDPPA